MERNRKAVRARRRKVNWTIATIIILLAIAMLTYYSYQKITTIKDLDVTVTEVSAADFTLTRFTLKITVDIHNTNTLEASVGKFHAWVFANNIQTADFKIPETITILPGETVSRTVELKIDYLALGESMINAIKSKQLTWLVQGEYEVRLPFGIPYEFTFRKEHTWSPNSPQ